MESDHEGGCLCGATRYSVTGEPEAVSICHCMFCQRFTGSAFLVEPLFKIADVKFSGAELKTYQQRSDRSKRVITLNFCGNCGTTLFAGFEHRPDTIGMCGGTFDDPNWFDRSQGKCRHIFTRSAQKGVFLPPGIDTYETHVTELDGTPNEPTIFAHAVMARDET